MVGDDPLRLVDHPDLSRKFQGDPEAAGRVEDDSVRAAAARHRDEAGLAVGRETDQRIVQLAGDPERPAATLVEGDLVRRAGVGLPVRHVVASGGGRLRVRPGDRIFGHVLRRVRRSSASRRGKTCRRDGEPNGCFHDVFPRRRAVRASRRRDDRWSTACSSPRSRAIPEPRSTSLEPNDAAVKQSRLV
jgi:hypothetical protein